MELDAARRVTDELFALVCPDALYERPVPERHRLIFYLGHLEAFDWNLIGRYALSVPAFHAEFDRLFAFGIDPDESGLPQDGLSDWPSTAEIGRYNARVRESLDRVLAEAPAPLVDVAIEHRLMHAETFAYLLHGLDYGRKVRAPEPTLPPAPSRSRMSGTRRSPAACSMLRLALPAASDEPPRMVKSSARTQMVRPAMLP